MTKIRSLPAILLASSLLVACGSPDAGAVPESGGHGFDPGLQESIDHLIDTDMATGAFLRFRDGDQIWTGAAGVADRIEGGEVDPLGYFRIGSVTKTFVATVVLQLVDEQRLALDDPIEEHLPGLVPNGDQMTVRQILDHSSGIYDYANEEHLSTNRWRGDARFDTYEPAELVRVAVDHGPYFDPWEQGWQYSNTNYVVAAMLIEQITDQPYGQEVHERILAPLRLTDTSVPGTEPGLPVPHTHGYTVVDGQPVDATEMNPSLDWAAGEMISTTEDLDEFLTALLGGELLSAESLTAMRTTVDTATAFAYGLGYQEFELPCGVTLGGHSGQLIGYLTYAVQSEDGRTLVLSYNPGETPTDPAALIGLFDNAFCQR